MVFTVLCVLFRVFIVKRVSRILCTLVVIAIFCRLRFELFIFFAESFCTQVNGSVICNPYLQDKLVYIYEKLYLLHRRRALGLHRSPVITPCQSRVVGDSCQHRGFPSRMPPPQCPVLVISAPVVSCDAVHLRMADITAARVVVQSCHGFRI